MPPAAAVSPATFRRSAGPRGQPRARRSHPVRGKRDVAARVSIMNRRFALIQVALSLVALAAVVWWAAHQEAPQLPDSAGAIGLMVTAAFLYAAATAVRAERWRWILREAGVKARRGDAYGLTTVGYMGNNVLPARAGEMLRVVLLSKRTDAGKRKLLGTVVAERVLDAIALVAIFLVVVYGILTTKVLPTDRPLLAGAVCVVLLAGLVAAVAGVRRFSVFARVRDFARPLADAPRALVGWEGARLLVVTFAIWALEASVYLTVARAVDLPLGVMESLYLVALANFFAALPAAPGSIGTFDAAIVFGVRAIDYASMAFSYLLMLRFMLYGPITLVGLVVLVVRYGGWSRLAEARRAARLEASRA